MTHCYYSKLCPNTQQSCEKISELANTLLSIERILSIHTSLCHHTVWSVVDMLSCTGRCDTVWSDGGRCDTVWSHPDRCHTVWSDTTHRGGSACGWPKVRTSQKICLYEIITISKGVTEKSIRVINFFQGLFQLIKCGVQNIVLAFLTLHVLQIVKRIKQ